MNAPSPGRAPVLLVNLYDPAYPADRLGPAEPLGLEYARADLARAGLPYLWMDAGNDPLGPASLAALPEAPPPIAVVAHGGWTALVENEAALARWRRDHPEGAVLLVGPGLAPMAEDLIEALAFVDAVVEDEAAGAVSEAVKDRLAGRPVLQRPGLAARGRFPAPAPEPPPPLAPERESVRRWAGEGLVPTVNVRATERRPPGVGPLRPRPGEAVIAEVEAARRLLGPEGMDPLVRLLGPEAFAPDSHAELEAFADALLEAGGPFLFEMEARVADLLAAPEALLRFLHQTGLRLMSIDLSPRSPAEAARDGLGVEEESFARLVRALRAIGVDVRLGGLALLHPFQTLKGYERAVRALEALHLSHLMHVLGRAELLPRSPMLLACLKHGLLRDGYEFGRVRDYAFADPAIEMLAAGLDGPGWEALYDEIECAHGVARELIVLDERAERAGAMVSRRFKLLYLGERSKVAWALRSLADVTGDHLRTVTLEHLRRGRAPTWSEWRRHLRHVAGVADFVHLAYAKFIQRIQEARSRDE